MAEEINLYDLLRFYKKRWLALLLTSLAGLALAALYTYVIQTPLYTSNATMIAVGTADKASGQTNTQLNNYIQLFNSRRVLEPVLQQQHSNLSYEALSQKVKASNDKNTELLKLSVTNHDAKNSQRLANGVIASFRKEIKTIYGSDNIDVVDDANLPTMPANVRPLTQLAFGVAAGLLLAVVGLFFAFDFSQSKLAGLSAEERLVLEKAREEQAAEKRAAKRAKRLAKKQARAEARAARRAARRQRRDEKRRYAAEKRETTRRRWAEKRARWSAASAQRRQERQARWRSKRAAFGAKLADIWRSISVMTHTARDQVIEQLQDMSNAEDIIAEEPVLDELTDTSAGTSTEVAKTTKMAKTSTASMLADGSGKKKKPRGKGNRRNRRAAAKKRASAK